MRFVLSLFFVVLNAIPVLSEPITYRIDPAKSKVTFTYMFGDRLITGSFPEFTTELVIDFQNIANSRTSVTANAQKIRGGFPFATGVLRGPSMLDTDKFPKVTFKSNRVTGGGNTAQISGAITIKGKTNPQTFTAKLFRPAGSNASDTSDLRLKLTGSLNRHDFGASAFPNEVGKTLTITVDARILAQ